MAKYSNIQKFIKDILHPYVVGFKLWIDTSLDYVHSSNELIQQEIDNVIIGLTLEISNYKVKLIARFSELLTVFINYKDINNSLYDSHIQNVDNPHNLNLFQLVNFRTTKPANSDGLDGELTLVYTPPYAPIDYDYETGAWSEWYQDETIVTRSSRSRGVSCQRSDGIVVPDSYCNRLGRVKPDSTEIEDPHYPWTILAETVTDAPTFSLIPNSYIPTSKDKWAVTVLAPNGKIYGIPYDSDHVIIYDPGINAVDSIPITINASVSGKWFSGVVINSKIYCLPYNHNKILIIDTSTDTLEYISEVGINNRAWISATYHENGNIYGCPSRHSSVLEVGTTNWIRPYFDFTFTDNKWFGFTQGINGKLYAAPASSYGILEFSPENKTHRFLVANINTNLSIFPSNTLELDSKWGKGVLAPNGKIYFPPNEATCILCLNPAIIDNDENLGVTTFGNFSALPNHRYQSGVLGPNGKIYFFPINNPNILEVDPKTHTTILYKIDEIETYLADKDLTAYNSYIFSGTVGLDGNIYCLPFDGTKIIKINLHASPRDNNALFHEYFSSK